MKNTHSTTRLIYYTGIFLLCSLFLAGFSFAAGRMLLKPHIETGWERDTNFHKSQTNERKVDTFYVKPGVEFGYTTDKSLVSLDYWFNVLRYDDVDDNVPSADQADRYDYTEHMADFTAQTQATEQLLIGLDNLFWKTRDPANADANSDVVERYKYTMNQFTPRLNYNFGEKFGLGLKYTNKMTDYKDDDVGEGEDSDENRLTTTFYYYFNSLTSFDLDYQFWNMDYDKTSIGYDSHQIMLNMNKQFNYLTFSVGAGYQKREFDDESQVIGGDIDDFVWKVAMFGQNPPDATSKPQSSVYLSFGSNLNDAGQGNSYHNSTRMDARFTYLFFERLNLTLDGWFQNSDYQTSNRDDDRWYIAAALDYYMLHDKLSIGLQTGAEERDSNIDTNDFDNQFVMVNVKFNYDMGTQ